ncbi:MULTISPECIES: hypothetical protein [Paraburkholderia]|uniref:hypothetical protein n=1 Tax=Paraburkholderia TaxID=1822464 RepID=UPI002259EDA4|nr:MULTISPECIES: hypothetical protein [Paraburkholderia]MCX4154996.1 hypothetical protein [Paraburkholderia aspalathi]MDN7164406.1 hypothetical protein [Paraburkholderia sp. SECH2]MDQ6392891.1 hypothetical protein [Paraburkholderia aspalathi]
MAATLIGVGRITAITDNSKTARSMTAVYDMVRLGELRKHFWSFASARAMLPALATPPAWQFGNACQLPADFVRLIQVNDFYADPAMMDYRNQDDSAYTIENDKIFTDFQVPLKIRYIQDVTDTGRFDPLFCLAIAAQLAWYTCEELTNSDAKRQTCLKAYAQAIQDAMRANAFEKAPEGMADDSWMLIRL